jgi:hypothetical protein
MSLELTTLEPQQLDTASPLASIDVVDEAGFAYLSGDIDFGATGKHEIFQNIKFIVLTEYFSVPLDREFGMDYSMVDKPMRVAEAIFAQEVAMKISLYEPRAQFREINYKEDMLSGKLAPSIRIALLSTAELPSSITPPEAATTVPGAPGVVIEEVDLPGFFETLVELAKIPGPPGPPGVAGPIGPTGPVGMVWRGEYNPDVVYEPNDAVSHNGSSFICRVQTQGNAPEPDTASAISPPLATTGSRGSVPPLPTQNQSSVFLRGDNTWRLLEGNGDVLGPPLSVANELAIYIDATGKSIGRLTPPAGVLVGTSAAQTLTNKTLSNPVINTPTGLTKADVGLSNADNTSDANKPVSTAQQAALNLKEDKANKAAANGYASLDAGVRVPNAQMPTDPSFATVTSPKHIWTGTVQDLAGSGSPEGVVTAPIGSLYRRIDGGINTSLYVKESGVGNTGWIAYGRAAARERLLDHRIIYVRTDGNDNNNGLTNDASGAFQTIQNAFYYIAQKIDGNAFNVTIKLGQSGTYAGANFDTELVSPWNGYLTIEGDTVTPGNTIILGNNANAIHLRVGALKLQYVKLQTTGGSGHCISVRFASVRLGTGVNFGPCVGSHISLGTASSADSFSNYTISGGSQVHLNLYNGAAAEFGGGIVTLSGTPNFSDAFCQCNQSMLSLYGITFSGAATGKRYDVQAAGVIQTFGAGATYLPGNVSGTQATGGQYI